jgi:hypothetical protein
VEAIGAFAEDFKEQVELGWGRKGEHGECSVFSGKC